MELQNDELNYTPNEVQQDSNTTPNAYRVDDDGNPDEGSLKKNYGIGGETKDANAPGMEGEGMGGQNFGGANHPPTGDDPANPSRNAGYTNGYFAKTEPSDEQPENNNFKSEEQQGEPNYQTATSTLPNENAETEDKTETPGPNELPEQ